MLFVLKSFNKKYLQSAYLLAKSIGNENNLMYEFFNSVPNELKVALSKNKLSKSIKQNEIEWKYEVDLKTKELTFYANDNLNKATYLFTFNKINKKEIYSVNENELFIGKLKVKIENNYQTNFLKQTKNQIYVKPLLYQFNLHKINNEFVVKTINTLNSEVYETKFDNNLYPITNELETNH